MNKNLRIVRVARTSRVTVRTAYPPWELYPDQYHSLDKLCEFVERHTKRGPDIVHFPKSYHPGFRPLRKDETPRVGDYFWNVGFPHWQPLTQRHIPSEYFAFACCRRIEGRDAGREG